MNNKIIDIIPICNQIESEILQNLKHKKVIPHLVTILVGNDPSSMIYVNNKAKKSKELGINNTIVNLPDNIPQDDLISVIEQYNTNNGIDGILLQAPLPNHLNFNSIVEHIDPLKDVDGLHPMNFGKLVSEKNNGNWRVQQNYSGFVSCTPLGCMAILDSVEKNLRGKHAVVIGRSSLVGLPMSQLLINNDCTLSICNSHTPNLSSITKNADILICAIGKPHFITNEFVKDGSIIIDVGISRVNKNNKNIIVGDVDLNDVLDKVKYITKVPGGVGKTTISCLMYNISKKFF